jgi:hypothetical protein
MCFNLAKEIRTKICESESTESGTPQNSDPARPAIFKFPNDDSFWADDHVTSTADNS